MKKIVGIVISILLAIILVSSCSIEPYVEEESKIEEVVVLEENPTEEVVAQDESKKETINNETKSEEKKDENKGKEEEKVVVQPPVETPKSKYVTILITCNTILNNMDKLKEEKKSLVPSNGIILKKTKVEIKEGDTVFDVLSKVTRKNRIHLDFVESPGFKSTYIKGINNIYEFDAGDLSGWMYKVNGIFPNYGCSSYKLKDGEEIEWQYTCDLGRDIGKGF